MVCGNNLVTCLSFGLILRFCSLFFVLLVCCCAAGVAEFWIGWNCPCSGHTPTHHSSTCSGCHCFMFHKCPFLTHRGLLTVPVVELQIGMSKNMMEQRVYPTELNYIILSTWGHHSQALHVWDIYQHLPHDSSCRVLVWVQIGYWQIKTYQKESIRGLCFTHTQQIMYHLFSQVSSDHILHSLGQPPTFWCMAPNYQQHPGIVLRSVEEHDTLWV